MTAGAFVILSAIFVLCVFLYMTRDITYYGTNSDNHKWVSAAASAGQWKWPSDMHKFGEKKTYVRDFTVIFLVLLQRLLGDKESNRPLVALAGLSNTITAVFVYFVVRNYFGTVPALFSYALYIMCFFPWMIALLGQHACLGQAVFLLTVLIVQAAGGPFSLFGAFLYFLSGVTFTMMNFSSSSARKLVILVMGALLYSKLTLLTDPGVLLYAILPFFAGAAGLTLFMLLPDLKANIWGYLNHFYFLPNKGNNHFKLYEEYFDRTGHPISKTMRGAGWPWIWKFFGHTVPWQSAVFGAGVIFSAAAAFGGLPDIKPAAVFFAMLFLGFSPVIWGEITRGPQIGRSYLQGLLGMILFIAFSIYRINLAS
ncbi:MAG: hypothetical protein AABZ57_01560, partial [Candidatus Margulisiibacteriota bacterium]